MFGQATGNCAKGFCSGNGRQFDFPCPDAVRCFVQQTDRRIAMWRFRLVANRWIRAECICQLAVDRVEIAETDLVDNRHTIQTCKQRNTAVRLGALQRLYHQAKRIEAVVGIFGAVINLAYADDNGNAFIVIHARH